MKTERTIDRVLEALNDIRSNLDEQIRRAQLEYVANVLQEQKEAIADCLDGIDQQLITLSVYVEEYQRLCSSLKDLNGEIVGLGGAPPETPEKIAGDSLTAILTRRVDHLKSQGKI